MSSSNHENFKCNCCGETLRRSEEVAGAFDGPLCRDCQVQLLRHLSSQPSSDAETVDFDRDAYEATLRSLQREKLELKKQASVESMARELREKYDKVRRFDAAEEAKVYCDDLSSQVHLALESAQEHLRNLGESLQQEVNDFQTRLKASRASQSALDPLVTQQLDAFEGEIDDLGVDEAGLERAQQIELKLVVLEDRVKKSVFQENQMKFRPNDLFYDSNDHVGRFDKRADRQAKEKRPQIDYSLLFTLRNHSVNVFQVIFLPNGNLVSCSSDKSISVWDPNHGQLLYELKGHTKPVFTAVHLEEDNRLASGSADRTIIVWNLKSLTSIRTLRGHIGRILSLKAVSRTILASCSRDNSIRLWNLETGEQKCLFDLTDYRITETLGLLFNDLLVFYREKIPGNEPGTLVVWKARAGGSEVCIQGPAKKASVLLVLSNDDVAVGYFDGSLVIFDLVEQAASRTLPQCHDAVITSLVELPQRLLATSSNKSTLKIWSLDDLTLVKEIASESSMNINSLAFLPERSLLVCAFDSSGIKVFELYGLGDEPPTADLLNRRYRVLDFVAQDSFFRSYTVLDYTEKKRKILTETFESQGRETGLVDSLLKLKHENVIRLFDRFSQENKLHKTTNYLIIEDYLMYPSLKQYVEKDFTLEQRLQQGHGLRALKWSWQLVEAIEYLHLKGIIHGALKSSSVFLADEYERVRIGLPDLARNFRGKRAGLENLESLMYSSPKLIQASINSSLHQRDDCWAFGCILYEIVNLKPAFAGSNYHEISKAIIETQVPPIANIDFEDLYFKLMHKEESSRIEIAEAKELLGKVKSDLIIDNTNIEDYSDMRRKEPEKRTKLQLIEPEAFAQWLQANGLDLSHNEIISIQAGDLQSLQKSSLDQINMSSNRIMFIDPGAFIGFENLKALNLSGNQLEELEPSLFRDLGQLRSLDLSDNRIVSLDSTLFAPLSGLDFLDLSKNKLRFIRLGFFSSLLNLQVLNLSNNEILEIEPMALNSLNKLLRLYLDHNRLSEIDVTLLKATTRLIELRLDNNNIYSIHYDAFRNLLNLRQLDLSHNQLTKLSPDTFTALSNLQSLNIGSNFLESVYHVRLGSMTKLRELRMNDNNLKHLDMSILNQFVQLKLLDVSDNILHSIELQNLTICKQGVRVILSGNDALIAESSQIAGIKAQGLMVDVDHIKCIKTRTKPKARLETNQQCLTPLARFSESINLVLFLTGNRIAICVKSIKIWSIEDAQMIFELTGHAQNIDCMLQLPNGWLASGARDGTINLWDVDRGELVRTLEGHTREIIEVVALPDGCLASSSADGSIKLWKPTEPDPLQATLTENLFSVKMSALSTRQLVTCSNEFYKKFSGELILWSLADRRVVKSFKPFAKRVKVIQVLTDDKIAVGFEDGSISIVDVLGQSKTVSLVKCHDGEVRSMLEMPDGLLLSSSIDKTLKVWNMLDRELILVIPTDDHLYLAWSLGESGAEVMLAFCQVDHSVQIQKVKFEA